MKYKCYYNETLHNYSPLGDQHLQDISRPKILHTLVYGLECKLHFLSVKYFEKLS